ncbi:hypothetical protein CRM22_001238 [Opisthorchis felineus]|uniref:Claspin n=1 Tax=Opisthorchis felineus TaxID=147828 RepID=A0A4S2MBH8_OPIFE|nr:hypothetical protein CRM22_001238 [Opisthorchis felineus]
MNVETEYETTAQDPKVESGSSDGLEDTLVHPKLSPSEESSHSPSVSSDEHADAGTGSQFEAKCEDRSNQDASQFNGETLLDADSEVAEDRKVGRWTHCKGAARKQSRTSTKSSNVEGFALSVHESNKLDIYRESQRLMRETDIHLLEHKPKQFKRFSEFRQSLAKASGTSELSIPRNSELVWERDAHKDSNVDPTLESSRTTASDSAPESQVIERVQPIASTEVEPVSNLQRTSLLKQLPSVLPPVKRLGEGEHDVIDLGESLLPISKPVVTPADYLMDRLLKHTRPPPRRKERGPVEYEVITRVVDPETGSDQLHVEKVTHISQEQPDTVPVSQRRKYWKQHREKLREQMRQRRLQLYEERMQEARAMAGKNMLTTTNEEKLSDDDEEWVESEDAESSSASTLSSSSSETTDIDDDEDAEDEDSIVGPSSRRHPCVFADDEAEESEDGADEPEPYSESDDTADEGFPNESHSKRLVESLTKRPTSPNRSNTSRFEKFLELDDYTDLPTEEIAPSFDSSRRFYVDSALRNQGSLGPGDVDLFTSDYSTILDRTTHIPSMLASTRLEKSTIHDPQRVTSSRTSRESSVHSQWNDTPYELLYSQRALSQKSSFSDKLTGSVLQGSTNNPDDFTRNPASQDTVILSQVSWNAEAEPRTQESSTVVDTTQDSQTEHANRRALFSDPSQRSIVPEPVCLQSSEAIKGSKEAHAAHHLVFSEPVSSSVEVNPGLCDLQLSTHSSHAESIESQKDHAARLQLFAGSFELENQSSTEPLVRSSLQNAPQEHDSESQMSPKGFVQGSHSDAGGVEPCEADTVILSCAPEQESQREHDARCVLFAGSFVVDGSAPVGCIEETISLEITKTDSQRNHNTRFKLFSGSFAVDNSAVVDDTEEVIRSQEFTEDDVSTGATEVIAGNTENSPLRQKLAEKEDTKPVRRHRLFIQDDEEEDSSVCSIKSDKSFEDASPGPKSTSPAVSEEDTKVDGGELDGDSPSGASDEKGTLDDGTESVDSVEAKELSDAENEYVSDEEEAQVKQLKSGSPISQRKKRFRVDNFLDEEAELSGDENERAYYMDDEDDDDGEGDSDEMEFEDDANLPSAGRLRRQVERVHQRLQADQDQRELRFLKELYFEDGDLYAETGQVRQRRFRWRGLDAQDPLIDQPDTETADYSDEDEDQDRAPFGPMDRWLAGGLHRKPVSTDKVDLDSVSPTKEQAEQRSSDADDVASHDENDDPSITPAQSESQLQSLGRQALIKAKSRKQTLLAPNNTKPPVLSTTSVSLKSKCVVNSQPTLISAFQVKKPSESHAPQYHTSSSVIVPRSDTTSDPVNGELYSGSNSKLRKRGSLLSRVFTVPHSDIGRFVSEDSQSELMVKSNDNSSSCSANFSSQPNLHRSQAHFLGLRNKIGLSCFNVLSQTGTNATDSSSQESGLKRSQAISFARPAEVGKRTSVGPGNPPKLKRPRSMSVFSALQ